MKQTSSKQATAFVIFNILCISLLSANSAEAAGGVSGGSATGGTGSTNASSPNGMGLNNTSLPMNGRSSAIQKETGATGTNPFSGVPVGEPLQPNDLGYGQTGNGR